MINIIGRTQICFAVVVQRRWCRVFFLEHSLKKMAEAFFKSSEETTNGLRLWRLVNDGGTHVLREVFNSIHPVATLQSVFKTNFKHLDSLKSKRVMIVLKQTLSELNASEMNCLTFLLPISLKKSLKTNGRSFLRHWQPWDSTSMKQNV